MKKLQALLNRIFDAYHDYVNECLMYDTPTEEIAGFVEWSCLHYGVEPDEAHNFYYQKAA